MIIRKSFSSGSIISPISNLLNNTANYFSSDVINLRVQKVDPSTGKQNDPDPTMYHNNMFVAYL